MPQGTIKKLVMDKGFGFIQGERGDLFFHHSALDGMSIEELREGQQVEYEEGQGQKGPRAENVKPLIGVVVQHGPRRTAAPGAVIIEAIAGSGSPRAIVLSAASTPPSALRRPPRLARGHP